MKYRIKKVTYDYKNDVFISNYYPQRRFLGIFWLYFKQDANYDVVYDTEEKARKFIENHKKLDEHERVEYIYE